MVCGVFPHIMLLVCMEYITLNSLIIVHSLEMTYFNKSNFLLVFIWSFSAAEHKIIFSEGYSVNERPPTREGKPLLIESSINLRNILDVSEKEQIISLETTLRLYWKVGTFGLSASGIYCSTSGLEYLNVYQNKTRQNYQNFLDSKHK